MRIEASFYSEPGFTGGEDFTTEEVVEDDASHHVPSGECAGDEFVASDLVVNRITEMADVEEDEADEQERKRCRHRTVYAHRTDPEDNGKEGPRDKEPADIGMRGGKDTEIISEQHQAEADPESTVSGERTVAEIVAHFHLLETGDHLDKAAENEAYTDDRAGAHPSHVVELEQKRGQAEPGETDHRRIGEFR